jgi:glycosyltransferase involved in cell wall biosynthesis
VSEWERDQLSNDFGVEATVIPNGVAIDRFAGATPVERNRPYLLTVGRLEEYKGVQHVIRAMAALPEYDLLVAGKGPYQEELEEISRKEGVENQVEFLRYVDDEKLPKLYAGADMYMTMSEFEAYGMTVAEALASGTPCVVSKDAALQGWAQYQGVVGITNISKERIKKAIKTVSVNKITDNSIKTWDEIVESVEETYENQILKDR